MATKQKVSVSALGTPEKDGFLTKQGGSIKTWKKRWFVLKGDTLYYFKTQKDPEQTGEIKLEKTTTCTNEAKKKGKVYFAVNTPNRKYLIHADTEESANQWVDKINKAIESLSGGGAKSAPKEEPTKKEEPVKKEESKEESTPTKPAEAETPKTTLNLEKKEDTETPKSGGSGGGAPLTRENKIMAAKNAVPFLQDDDSKVLEFWQIWSESIPESDELAAGTAINYHVSTSANRNKLTWRTSGPQNVLIQKMVDFFWNVGAPESEIDRLNDIGALINPAKIGSWIDMSAKGGMDGGWFFPVEIPVAMAVEAADPGEPTKAVSEWTEKHSIQVAQSVGRDMGAAPPRQTEIRLNLPGNGFNEQLEVGLDAFSAFGFPELPESALSVLKNQNTPSLSLSIITSSEGFVRLGLLCPKPSKQTIKDLCDSSYADVEEFENALSSSGPALVEYQFLKEGFGYGVYKEGFDIVFHYDVDSDA
eukprot:CAMPEP_0206193376 /NCGR_PEP_ID=MMETSP0166-20121206/6526_1 /ASSEMBLY_ACC=CAM_ASM_000260 /TAXON_ID=95228 /ORGANISM="Vannella robusta, Strain DIVA3 518/3/11/1/6" /LENGTH=475 /DNA_ID=CAMNT_0053610069 /DNA_START=96 /DNA_END=1523 /DNA_ORIENTATION=-